MRIEFKLGAIVFLISALLCGCTQQPAQIVLEDEPAVGIGSAKAVLEDEGPSQGGILNLFMTTPNTLNPLNTQNPYVRHLAGFVFDSLFIEKADGSMEPRLVETSTLSRDGLKLDLKLRDDVFFHDGQALTSDDVLFAFESIRRAGERSLYGRHISNIQNVMAIDRLNVRLVLERPDEKIVEKLTFPVIPRHVFKDWPIDGHQDELKVIGTGPFKFISYQNQEISLLRNDDWWLQKSGILKHPVWLNGIVFKIYPDESEMMSAFQKQQIDIAFLEDGDLESYSKRSDIHFRRYENNALEFMVLSYKGEPGSPISQEPFRTVLLKYLSWYASLNPLSTGNPAFESLPEYGSVENRLNRDDAIKALQDAGFTYQEDKNKLYWHKNGAKLPVVLSIKYNALNTDRQKTVDNFAGALFDLGIQVVPESASYADEKQAIEKGSFDIMLLGCRMPYFTGMDGTLELIRTTLGLSGQNAVIMPLYRKHGAVLYSNRIKGPREPVWKDVYNGWPEWYLVHSSK